MKLTEEEETKYLKHLGKCPDCHEKISQSYCQTCDDFIETGHTDKCERGELAEEHSGHRIQTPGPVPLC